jgi:FkbM family methyltransferase
MKQFIKKIMPIAWWNYLRTHQSTIVDAFSHAGKKICTMPYGGYTLFYGRGDALVARLKRDGTFEQELCDALIALYEPYKDEAPLFIDIGANIGLISLALLSRIPRATIYAFEPGPYQRSFLESTVAENKISKRIHVIPYAVSDATGVASFATHKETDVSKDGLIDTGRASDARTISVKATSFDTWWKLAGSPRAQAVKIDTEGAELKVLEGMKEFVASVHPVLFLEIEPRNMKPYGHDENAIYTWCEKHHYRLYTIKGELCDRETMKAQVALSDAFVAVPVPTVSAKERPRKRS